MQGQLSSEEMTRYGSGKSSV